MYSMISLTWDYQKYMLLYKNVCQLELGSGNPGGKEERLQKIKIKHIFVILILLCQVFWLYTLNMFSLLYVYYSKILFWNSKQLFI